MGPATRYTLRRNTASISPLLVLLYINDLPNAVNCIPTLFADDTCLISRNFNLSKLESDMNEDLVKIHKWCLANKVTINPVKSSALIIPPKINKSSISAETAFTIKKAKIFLSPFVKYLGLLIDNKLNIQTHTALLEKKLAERLASSLKSNMFFHRSYFGNYISYFGNYISYLFTHNLFTE